MLAQQDNSTRVNNMATIKPLDKHLILEDAKECRKIVSCEEHFIISSLGEAVCAVIAKHGLPCSVERVGDNDEFGHSSSAGELLKQSGLCTEYITEVAKRMCKEL